MAHIVAIGGGHGLSAMLRGLKRYTKYITAIVTVADDGGGSGMLREDLGMLPRAIFGTASCLLRTPSPRWKLLNYRFTEGSLAGQSFGNLFLAAMNGISGSLTRPCTAWEMFWPSREEFFRSRTRTYI